MSKENDACRGQDLSGGLVPVPVRIGAMATVQVSSTTHASGTLSAVHPDGMASVDLDGRTVRGALILSMRRAAPPAERAQIRTEIQDDVPDPY